MFKLSLIEKKLAIAAFLTAMVLVIFVLCVLLPAQRSLQRARRNLAALEQEIRKAEEVLSQEENSAEGLKTLEVKLRQIDSRFASSDEDALKALSEAMRRFNLEVVLLEPAQKAVYLNRRNQEVTLDGKTCYKLGVSLQLNSGYKELVNFLSALKQELPIFATIEKIKIIKAQGAAQPNLNIGLELTLYLLC
jgi:superfamily II RNA helicase